MSLTARHLEANGIPTVIIGSALDIVTYCRAPRYLYTELPLGNPCGVPYDIPMQKDIMAQALTLLGNAMKAETVETSSHQWPGNPRWRDVYARVNE